MVTVTRKQGPSYHPTNRTLSKQLLISSSARCCPPLPARPPARMRTPIRAVERREQRVLERLVRYGLAEVVVHAPRGGEDAGRGLKQLKLIS